MAMSTFQPEGLLPPPTSNTMDPDQRTRLVRTARKLETILGTTPQVVESNDHSGCPSTKARRRNVAYGSPSSSSISSLDSITSEKEYHGARVRPVDSHQRTWPPSPNTSQCSSPTRVLVATDEMRAKKTKGPQPLAQPLLLRMSAVPVSNHARHSSLTVTAKPPRPAKRVPAPIHVPAPPLVTPSERRKLKVDSVLGPLSPINKSHFPSRCDSDLGLLPTLTDTLEASTGLSDREKRIKLAKLQRIMGENIPPELVFRETSSLPEKRLKRRSRSMSALRPGAITAFFPIPEEPPESMSKGKGRQTDIPPRPLPTVPISCTPLRSLPTPPIQNAPVVTQTTTTTSGSLLRQPSLSMQQKSRKSRPRSLSLGTDSAIVAANVKLAQQEREEAAAAVRVTLSLDEGRKWHAKNPNDKGKVVEGTDAPFSKVREKRRTPNLAVLKTELWKRMEQEWTGEWNVKDMNEVARALRSLKAS